MGYMQRPRRTMSFWAMGSILEQPSTRLAHAYSSNVSLSRTRKRFVKINVARGTRARLWVFYAGPTLVLAIDRAVRTLQK